ncbi:TPA: hypothetical protein DCE37_23905 [Candidatus Latescibacteria bacterium]|nr:hypothetical protein [Candidatus Latescibacterota bacterium]
MWTFLIIRLSALSIPFNLVPVAFLCGQATDLSHPDAYTTLPVEVELDGRTLNVNEASRDQLISCPLLDDESANRIIRERGRRAIPDLDYLVIFLGWPPEYADHFAPHFQFERKARPRAIRVRAQILATSRSRSTDDVRLLSRLAVRADWFEFGSVTERDPGERSLADHAAGYINIRPSAIIEITAGHIRPGLGLAHSRQKRSALMTL